MDESITLGRTIKLFLVDGTPTGIITAEIMNWTGKVLVAPRTGLPKLASRPEVSRTGVYLLIGDDPEDQTKKRIYIGESDDVKKRLSQHADDEKMDFFTRVCLVVSADANLTKAHARWLESRLIEAAKSAKRASIVNGTDPGFDGLPESDKADMRVFLAHLGLVLPVLGLDMFLPQPKVPTATILSSASTPSPGVSPKFEMAVEDAKATAIEVDGRIVILKGSTARRQGVPSWTSYRNLRESLEKDGRLADSPQEPSLLVFTDDVPFESPTAAAVSVAARNISGPLVWRIAGTKQTYRDWQQQQIATAGQSAG